MKYILIVYIIAVILYLFYQFWSIVKFRIQSLEVNAVFLFDKAYFFGVLLFNVVFFSMLFSEIYSVFSNISFYENNRLPFLIFTMPLMVILSSMMIKEGMYSYTGDALYGGNKSWDLSAISITAINKHTAFKRASISIALEKASSSKTNKLRVRTTMHKAKEFESLINKRNH